MKCKHENTVRTKGDRNTATSSAINPLLLWLESSAHCIRITASVAVFTDNTTSWQVNRLLRMTLTVYFVQFGKRLR